VITAGSPSELKAKVGGDHLELTVPDPEGRRTARELLGARAEPASDAEQQIIRIRCRPAATCPSPSSQS
jgi:hypothetical protein